MATAQELRPAERNVCGAQHCRFNKKLACMRLLVATCKAWKQATVNQVLKETKYKVGDSMERIGESDKVNPNPVLTEGNVLSITDTDGKVLKFQILKSRPGQGASMKQLPALAVN